MSELTSNDRQHGLDHLRAAAITLVLFFHYQVYYGVPTWLEGFSRFGWTGVDLFFVLSGYLIADKLFRERSSSGTIKLKRFYLSRSLRILPAYAAVLALYFSVPGLQEGRGLQPLWKFVSFTQNLNIDMYRNSFSHAWSLCVEEHFYILLPLILCALYASKTCHRAWSVFMGLFLAGALLRYGLWQWLVEGSVGREQASAAIKHIYYPSYTRLDGLLVGVGIATLMNYRPQIAAKILAYGNLLVVLAIALLFACAWLFNHGAGAAKAVLLYPAVSIAYGFMVFAALSPTCVLSRIRMTATALLASQAYCVYLIHKITNHLVNTQLADLTSMNNQQLFLASLIAAMLGGLFLHLTIEKPILVLRNKFLMKQ